MPSATNSILSYLRVMAAAWREEKRDDATLLARFAEAQDETAIATLVCRHGALVWRTCRRILGDTPDTEDAFQATFLALVRKAGRFPVQSLAGWLHQTARRVSLDAQARARRQRNLEQRLRTEKQSEAEGRDADQAELYAALDEELASLPEPLRVPLLLRYLEGKSQDEVAHILGCTRGMVRRRLARGEAILRQRLERRGLEVGIVSVGALLGNTVTASAVPMCLIDSTARAALRSLSFPPPLESSVSAALAEGVIKTMLMTKIKNVAVLLGVTLCLAGVGLLVYQALGGNTVEPLQLAGEPRGEAEASRQPEVATRVDCYGDPLPAHALARMGTVRLWRRRGWFNDNAALAFSPNGKTLAIKTDDMTACLWDATTGKEIRRLTTKAVQGGINSLGFSPDGKTLVAVTGWKWTVCRWDVATGKFLGKQEYQGPRRDNVQFLKLAFLPDGQMLGFGDFAAKEGREMCVWDVTTGKEICQLVDSRKRNLIGKLTEATFSPDGKLLATALEAGRIKLEKKTILSLWDVATGKEIRQLTYVGEDSINTVALSPDGKMLASETGQEKICVWEVATGKLIHLFEASRQLSSRLFTFSPDGKTLLGGGAGHLWDVVTGKEIRSFGWKYAHVALFSPDGKIVAVGDAVGSIRLWEVSTGKEIGPCKGFRGPIGSVAYSPDGKTLASMSQDGKGMATARLWEVATGKEIRQLAKNAFSGTGTIAYSPNGKILLSMDHNVLHLWDTATGKEIRQLSEQKRGSFKTGVFPWCATFSPDGKKVAAGCEQNELVSVWEVATGKQIYLLETQQKSIYERQVAIAFSPDGGLLATPGKENTVFLWESATGKLIGQLGRPKKQGFVFSLAFSSDSRLLATSSSGELGGKVRVWEVASGKEIYQLAALKPSFKRGCALAFSPDGRILATTAQHKDDNGHFDPTARLWDVASGKEIGQLAGHQGVIWTIAFSPDGKTLASGSEDLTCLVWDLTSFTDRSKPVPARLLPAQPLSHEQLEAAWADLAKDPAQAYIAIRTLQASPAQAIALLQARVRPVAPLTNPQQLKRWIADLDASSFTVREKAQREIEKLGEPAIPVLRQALEGRPTLEARRRLKVLVAEWESKVVVGDESPRRLREMRAVQVLKFIGTPEARQLLQAWAKGVPEARLTQEAEAALAHWAKRSAARP